MNATCEETKRKGEVYSVHAGRRRWIVFAEARKVHMILEVICERVIQSLYVFFFLTENGPGIIFLEDKTDR